MRAYEGSNEIYTKPYAVYPLVKYLQDFKDKVIWCPCDSEESEFVKIFREEGFKVENSHIDDGRDFYKYEPPHWDILITNPPFENKRVFMERVVSFNKPFCVLLPMTWLNESAVYDLFKDCGLELLIFRSRMHFKNHPSKNKKPTFSSGIKLKSKIQKVTTFTIRFNTFQCNPIKCNYILT